MTDQLSGSEAAKAISDPFGTLAGWVAGFLPEGPLRTLFIVVVGLCVAAAPFICRYYLGVLAQGAQPEGSLERQDYDRLRASLKGGNLAARLYARWLTTFLDGVERIFGDAGMADRTLFPFGLQKPAPLWTAPAFDRCLLLALLYPIATIFLVWAISGHVGPAEKALALQPDLPGWWRGLAAAVFGVLLIAVWRGLSLSARKRAGWRTFVVAICGTFIFADVVALLPVAEVNLAATVIVVAGAVAIMIFLAFALIRFADAVPVAASGAEAFAGALAVAVPVAIPIALAVFVAFPGMTGLTLGVAFYISIMIVFIAAAAFGTMTAIKHRRHGVFLALYLPAMIAACLGGADLLSPLVAWKWGMFSPLLLFMGLLTLLNAPFDWGVAWPDASAASAWTRTRGVVAVPFGNPGCASRRCHHRASRADHGDRGASF